MNVDMKVGARFNIVKTCTVTGRTTESGWFDNLVLDAGLNRIGVGSWASHCHVGTSSTPPATVNTSLGNQIAVTNTKSGTDTGGTSPTSPFYTFRRATFRFVAGTFNGQNLAEVAIGWGGTNIFNRALIRDNLGDPTTITVLSTEQLEVVTEVRVYQPETDVAGTITLRQPNGAEISTHSYVARRSAEISNPAGRLVTTMIPTNVIWSVYTGSVGTILNTPSGSQVVRSGVGGNTTSSLPYSNNSYEVVFNCNVSTDSGNSGTNKTLYLDAPLGTWQVEYTPALPKNNTQTLTIPIKISWGRYTP